MVELLKNNSPTQSRVPAARGVEVHTSNWKTSCPHCEIERLVRDLDEVREDVLTYLKAKKEGALFKSKRTKNQAASSMDYPTLYKAVDLGVASSSIEILGNWIEGLWPFLILQRTSKLPPCTHDKVQIRVRCPQHVNTPLASKSNPPPSSATENTDSVTILFDSKCPWCHAQAYAREKATLAQKVIGYIRQKTQSDRADAEKRRSMDRVNTAMAQLFDKEAFLYDKLADELEKIWPELHSLCEQFGQTRAGSPELHTQNVRGNKRDLFCASLLPGQSAAGRVKRLMSAVSRFIS